MMIALIDEFVASVKKQGTCTKFFLDRMNRIYRIGGTLKKILFLLSSCPKIVNRSSGFAVFRRLGYHRALISYFMKKMFLLGVTVAACSAWAAEIIIDGSQGQTIQSGVDEAKAGDTVIVKPGRYPEVVTFKTSGTLEAPITLKAEKVATVLVDGSDPVTGWQKVAKPEDVANTPNWKNIFFAEVPEGKTYMNVCLYEDGKFCAFAQDPVPSDPFNFDKSSEFMPVDEATYSAESITDPKYFIQKDPHYWDGASVIVWTANNNMMYRPIWGFHPETGTINYQSVGGFIHPNRDRFAVVNHLDFIRKPGDYVVKQNPATGKNTLYYWPYDAANLDAGKVTFAVRSNGIKIANKSYLTIEGFELRGHCGSAIHNGPGEFSDTITVRNNHAHQAQHEGWAISLTYVHNALAENNIIHQIQLGRGIGVSGARTTSPDAVLAKNPMIRNNRISRCGSTGINFYGVIDGKMIGNLVHDNNGHHGNGLTCYLGCQNILIEGNDVIRSNMAVTMQQGDNITVRNNVLIGNDPNGNNTVVAASYSNNMTNVTFEHNVMRDANSSFHLMHEMIGYKIRNNILNGIFIWSRQNEGGVVIEDNLITKETPGGRDKSYAENNTFELDISKVFVDADTGDFRRVPNGPLPQAGLLDGGRKVDLHPQPQRMKAGD